MSNKEFSSADSNISIKDAAKKNPAAIISGMSKDSRKRWILVGGVVIGGILLATTTATTPAKKVIPPAPPAVLDTSPKGLTSQNDWKAQTGADMQELRKELDTTKQLQTQMIKAMTELKNEIGKAQEAAKAAGQQAASSKSTGPVDLKLPAPPTPPRVQTPPQATVNVPSATIIPPTAGTATTTAQPAPAVKAPEIKRTPARSFVPATTQAANEGATQSVVQSMSDNKRKGFLPAGSFSAATMISGVEAFTGGTAQSQPQPVVLRLDANAVLPNAAKYQIKGCHVLASVWGDMSSERVFGRLATLTCVDVKNRLVLSEEVEGVLVDSDGKNGVRGQLLDRQGAKLARSLLAGFAEGLSAAFGSAQSTVTQTALGTTSAILSGNTMKAGAYKGAEEATSQLADFYLKQAEATMPVIAVDAGRKISVLFTKSQAMSFETTDSYREDPLPKVNVERPVR